MTVCWAGLMSELKLRPPKDKSRFPAEGGQAHTAKIRRVRNDSEERFRIGIGICDRLAARAPG
jgi:hypothetical protein